MKCPSFSFLSWLRAVKRFAPNDIPISAKRFFILSRLILCFEEGVWRGSSDILKNIQNGRTFNA